ncbi:hypothetical protein HK100_007921, partial [Physocladia obscura]
SGANIFCVDSKNTFCVSVTANDSSAAYEFRVTSSLYSWAEIGLVGDDSLATQAAISQPFDDKILTTAIQDTRPDNPNENLAFNFSVPYASISPGPQSFFYTVLNSSTTAIQTTNTALAKPADDGVNLFHEQFTLILQPQSLAVIAPVSYCTTGFCLYITFDAATALPILTVQSSAQGWAAVGVNTQSMNSGTIFVGWKDSRGGYTVSERIAAGFQMPQIAADQSGFVLTTVPTSVPSGGWNIAFSVLVQDAGIAAGAIQSQDFIFAFSDSVAADVDQADSSFPFHSAAGAFNLDATTEAAAAAAALNPSTAASVPAATSTTTVAPGRASSVQSATGTKTESAIATATVANNSTTTAANSTVAAAAGNFCSDSSHSFCVDSISDFSSGTVVFTLQTSSSGWVGIGIGSSMASASAIFVGWIDSSKNGSAVISQRTGAQHVLTPMAQTQSFTAILQPPKSAAIWPTSKTVISFRISLSLVGIAANSSIPAAPTSFIFGISNTQPSVPGNAASTFQIHETYGLFQLDLSKPSTGVGETVAIPTLIVAHGVAMFFAWFVFPSAAIFIARFLKHRLGHLWYQLHVGLMIGGTGLFIILGLALVEANVEQKFGLPSFHAKLGVAVALALYPLQVLLGYISNAKFSEDRTSIPWWDRLHWWSGRMVFLAAIVNIYLGLLLAGVGLGLLVAYPVVIALVVGVFAVAEWKIGAAHHVREEAQESDESETAGGSSEDNSPGISA